MRQGRAFSDLRTIPAGYYTIDGPGIEWAYDIIDLEFDGLQFFNSFRINFMMQGLQGVHSYFWFSLRLYHGDTIETIAPVTDAKDIIGPVDEYGQPRINGGGEWKKLITTDGISINDMGYQVYSVGYVGNKRYIRSYVFTPGDPGPGIRFWCFVVAMHTHAGKCYDRYKLEGIDGAQRRYP